MCCLIALKKSESEAHAAETAQDTPTADEK